MKINRTAKQNRENMGQLLDKVTVQNILTCFVSLMMILGFSMTASHAAVQIDVGTMDGDEKWEASV